MKETKESRISRLKSRRQDLRGQIRAIKGAPGVRVEGFKIDGLKDQVATMTDKIDELERKR